MAHDFALAAKVLLGFEAVLIVLFAGLTEYTPEALPKTEDDKLQGADIPVFYPSKFKILQAPMFLC